MPAEYEHTHSYIFDMFNNASHWPKQVIVSYKYEVENEEDISRGLYLLYALGRLVTLASNIALPPATIPWLLQ
jgi:hypothetical protein